MLDGLTFLLGKLEFFPALVSFGQQLLQPALSGLASVRSFFAVFGTSFMTMETAVASYLDC